MKIATNKTLRAVIEILQSKMANGAMEPGRAKAFTEAIRKLKRANQTKDHKAMSQAVDLVARLVLDEFR